MRGRDAAPVIVYRTQWSRSLRWLTALSLAIVVGLAVAALVTIPGVDAAWVFGIGVLPLIALATTLLRQIRGYSVTAAAVDVLHLGWRTRLDLMSLQSVAVDPQAMDHARMTFGTGNLPAFFHTFRNGRLGHFEAYATDRDRAVVLRFTEHVVVVTPADPDGFAATLRRLRHLE